MVLGCSVDQPNRRAFRCRANVNGERFAVGRAAGKLFQITGPATAKLLIPSVVLNINPVHYLPGQRTVGVACQQ